MEDNYRLVKLPLEIRSCIVAFCFKNSINDAKNLLLTCKELNGVAKSLSWKPLYYMKYSEPDELDATTPTDEIKLFLRTFLPSDPAASNAQWRKALLRRHNYDTLLVKMNLDKTKPYNIVEQSGWKTVPRDRDHPDNFGYHKSLAPETFRYGFTFDFDAVMTCLDEIETKFHLCFLELTLEKFEQDLDAELISVIDFYHFTKIFNPHVAYSRILCSETIPDPKPAQEGPKRSWKTDPSELIILNGDNIEYTIIPGREWGLYTNYACEGLLWGADLDQLLKTKYHLDMYNTKMYFRNDAFNDFKNLRQ